MIRFAWFSLGAAVALALSGLTAFAADEPRPAPSGEEITRWITNLDSDKYEERQEASGKLTAIGKPAIPALVKAATGDSLEVTHRALDVLKELYQSKDEATQKAAKEALEKLAQGSHAVAEIVSGAEKTALEEQAALRLDDLAVVTNDPQALAIAGAEHGVEIHFDAARSLLPCGAAVVRLENHAADSHGPQVLPIRSAEDTEQVA